MVTCCTGTSRYDSADCFVCTSLFTILFSPLDVCEYFKKHLQSKDTALLFIYNNQTQVIRLQSGIYGHSNGPADAGASHILFPYSFLISRFVSFFPLVCQSSWFCIWPQISDWQEGTPLGKSVKTVVQEDERKEEGKQKMRTTGLFTQLSVLGDHWELTCLWWKW